ncbi:glycosyltransferase family 39 protein [Desulfogranum japonicum]|uniref:glycosyltransferase family 39 protein n=1 Tax=Desulfogranum japonicum TaxID=231447 RepID=UPI0004150064|nr:glycosyltransferase family 39 protein [Desulfogranum japonicum]
MNKDSILTKDILPLFLLIAVYLAIILPTISVQGISNDEFIDHSISQTLFSSLKGWWNGSDVDPTQARLPMFLSGLFGTLFENPTVYTARFFSCIISVFTLAGIYLFGRMEFNRRTALLATGMAAVSPYFLAFSRTAMTEGDAFLACSSIWLMLTIAYWRRTPDLGRTGLLAFATGIMVSTKVIAAVWIPFLCIPFIFLRPRASKDSLSSISPLLVVLLLLCGIFFIVKGYYTCGAQHVANMNKYYDHHVLSFKIEHYKSVAVFWVAAASVILIRCKQSISLFWTLAIISTGSLLTFFVFPPTNLTNGNLLQGLYREFFSNGSGLSIMQIYSAAGLNILSLVIKSGLSVGIFILVAVLISPFCISRKPILILPVTMALVYPISLIFIGRAQTFYMMAILPQCALLAACLLDRIWNASKITGYALTFLFCGHCLYDIQLTYPNFHLNGYQWLGKRYIAGRSSIGYKGIVQIPSDGTTQVLKWAVANIPPEQNVVAYLNYRMMAHAFIQAPFYWHYGLDIPWSPENANYVLIHFNYIVDTNYTRRDPRESIFDYPFNKEQLERDFEKVYAVKRNFDIEVASIWKRKQPIAVDQATGKIFPLPAE